MTKMSAHLLLAGDIFETYDGFMTVRSVVEDLLTERVTVYATDSKKAPRTFEYSPFENVNII